MTHESILSLRDLNRKYIAGSGEEVWVLRDVNVEIEAGTFNVIRGASGSGKTTLLRILGMLDTGFTGEYLFEGVSVSKQPDWYLDELRANNLGFVFQEGRLFRHMTVRRNIEVPLELHGARQRAEFDEKINELAPVFFNEEEIHKATLDNLPAKVSGGQLQRGSIMRAVIDRPSIILADEPTASLHGDLKQEVVEHLHNLVGDGHTVIVVSHDPVFFNVGRQLDLVEGRLTEADKGKTRSEDPIPARLPDDGRNILYGWVPRAPFTTLLQQAVRETFGRKLLLSLILIALVVGIAQISVFSSVIIGARQYVNDQITKGSRLNRIEIAPRSRDRGEDDRFPDRADIVAMEGVSNVVPRRATIAPVMKRNERTGDYRVSGLHPDDPEYRLLSFIAGGRFSGDHNLPEVILTTDLMNEVFDMTPLEDGEKTYDDYLGESVFVIVNRFNTKRELTRQVPVEMKLTGIILNGEGGRQLYYPATTLLVLDAIIKDRRETYVLPENAGVNNWFEPEKIAEMTDYPWEDNLQVYASEIGDVMRLYSDLAKLGFKPESDIWDFKWALDIQDTAWRIFLPLLALIILSVAITVFANILTSQKLREVELALWRVLGMRRGDLVLTQMLSILLSVSIGALLGLICGAALIEQTRSTLQARAQETAEITGSEPQQFDAIFAPIGDFVWPLLIASIVIGLLAALYPAIRTAKTDPAKVLNG